MTIGIVRYWRLKVTFRVLVILQLYTVSGKKGATLFLPVTPRNADRFSKFFHCHALQ